MIASQKQYIGDNYYTCRGINKFITLFDEMLRFCSMNCLLVKLFVNTKCNDACERGLLERMYHSFAFNVTFSLTFTYDTSGTSACTSAK